MQFIFFSSVKFYLTILLLFISLIQLSNGLTTTFSSFLSNLDSTQQEDLANLQHSTSNQFSESNQERTCEELQSCHDQAGFDAIKWLHR